MEWNDRAARYGRKVRYAFNPFIGFGDSDEDAIARTKRLLTPDEPDADMRKMMSRVGPAMKSGCIGRPEKVREQLMKYVDMGIELFLLKFVPTIEEVRVIREEIIEPLRRRYPYSRQIRPRHPPEKRTSHEVCQLCLFPGAPRHHSRGLRVATGCAHQRLHSLTRKSSTTKARIANRS